MSPQDRIAHYDRINKVEGHPLTETEVDDLWRTVRQVERQQPRKDSNGLR